MHSLLKGFLISIVLLLGLGLLFFQLGIKQVEELGALFLLVPTFPIIGLALGFAANKIQTKRFLKLLLIGIIMIYSASVFLSTFLILHDNSNTIKDGEIFSSIFFLSTVGFFIYGILVFPFLGMGVFILERWTRPIE